MHNQGRTTFDAQADFRANGVGSGTQTGGSRRVFPAQVTGVSCFCCLHPARAGASTAQKDLVVRSKLDFASAIALASTLTITLLGADGSGAAAQARDPQVIAAEPAEDADQTQSVIPLPVPMPDADPAAEAEVQPDSLADMVTQQASAAPLSRELNCLAGAIYFESKSEPLVGQLAVGRVVVARSRSGRFPNSYCGVVFQPSQFSFVRGGAMPSIDHSSRGWKNAVAIAQIAHEGSWRSPVEGALFFHAARVSPGWRLARLARVGNHVFYR